VLDDVKSVGFLVNPIAGMGGAVGLKGTDGRKTLRDAVRKGAKPVSLERGLRFLEEVQRRSQGIEFLTAPGNMGASIADQLKLEHESVGRIGKTTTSDDSIRIARLMRRKRADLIVFCGGDGTARDVLEGVGGEAPALGVPAGVKIYSSVFATNPAAAAESTVAFLEGQIPTRLGEVVDVVKGNGTTLRLDVDEAALMNLIGKNSLKSSTKIIISPIGGQGFLFGRGNQQISPQVIRRVGVENITVVGSRSKIEALHPRRLLTDSGNDEIDQQLRGYLRVITGYREEMVVKVE